MRYRSFSGGIILGIGFTLSFLLGEMSAIALAAPPEGFTALFDGKTLNGWTIKCKPADKDLAAKFWTVSNGAITADSLRHKEHDYVWLTTNREYADFELRLRFQMERGIQGNSGIQIRSRYDDAAGYLDGPQLDINPPAPWRSGHDLGRNPRLPALAVPESAPGQVGGRINGPQGIQVRLPPTKAAAGTICGSWPKASRSRLGSTKSK